MEEHFARVRALHELLRALDGVAVAFSGGVDSTVLLHAATRTLRGRAVGVIADSPSLPRAELAEARAQAEAMGARLLVVGTEELSDPRYRRNAGDRCYFCKFALFDAMRLVAEREGLAQLAFGEITDDLTDDRPGARAAAEHGVVAPLREAGMGKGDVRRYAREHGLAAWDKPASACLASRLPIGTEVTGARLARVERSEARVRALGLRELRVRDHGAAARVEVGEAELEHAAALGDSLGAALRAEGFARFELAAYVPPALRLSAERSAAGPRAGRGTGS
jgi:uncharacterized protein